MELDIQEKIRSLNGTFTGDWALLPNKDRTIDFLYWLHENGYDFSQVLSPSPPKHLSWDVKIRTFKRS